MNETIFIMILFIFCFLVFMFWRIAKKDCDIPYEILQEVQKEVLQERSSEHVKWVSKNTPLRREGMPLYNRDIHTVYKNLKNEEEKNDNI